MCPLRNSSKGQISAISTPSNHQCCPEGMRTAVCKETLQSAHSLAVSLHAGPRSTTAWLPAQVSAVLTLTNPVNWIPFLSGVQRSHIQGQGLDANRKDMLLKKKISNLTQEDPCYLPKRNVSLGRCSLIPVLERLAILRETLKSCHIYYIFGRMECFFLFFPALRKREGKKRCCCA